VEFLQKLCKKTGQNYLTKFWTDLYRPFIIYSDVCLDYI